MKSDDLIIILLGCLGIAFIYGGIMSSKVARLERKLELTECGWCFRKEHEKGDD